ncbi:glycosyltransferase [Salinicoccus luteus]|uniref:glycosyltransferase n=1 Tax=Salinicoccus luteus TaxID=367840 RepID=UPI00146FABDE|nr:glycosyltransferase [Salinicoccus luteus]
MEQEETLSLENIDLNENYLLNLYRLAKSYDVDTYDNLFKKDVAQSSVYHNLSLNEYYKLFEEKGKPDFSEKIESLSSNAIESNGSRIFNKIDLKVGIICDEFLYNAYRDVVDLHYISFDDDDIDTYDFVIFATAWKGIDGSWQGVSREDSEERAQLYRLIDQCNDKGIPAIFYSKEDPVNYSIFVEIAKKCDVAFTSAEEIIPEYKQAVGHERVFKLEFGINPHYHNPIGVNHASFKEYKDDVIFAGSWMVKYPIRNEEAEMAFEGVKQAGRDLTIIDRNLRLENKRYHFPPKYIGNLTYPLTHDLLMKAHKIFRFAINVNSVKYSNTMFANRVFELQAFGNILLSNFSIGVNSKFPHVFIYNHVSDIKQFLEYTDEKTFREISAAGIRTTMNGETTYHRMQYIASKIGIDIEVDRARLLVVSLYDDEQSRRMFDLQTYRDAEMVTVDQLNDIDVQEYDFITFFDSNNYFYEEYHLEELVSAFKYTDTDAVAKNDGYEKYNFCEGQTGISTLMVDASVLKNGDVLDTLLETGNYYGSFFNIDTTEVVKTKADPQAHYDDKEEKELSVVVPIHNNGNYLENKCFRSLRRSSVFDKMEVIFVNDGSTNPTTMRAINRLRRRYPDIVYYEFGTASGSASKPRNKGVELASCELVTFLDPDNEATGDGYSRLLSEINEDPQLDMVVGNMVKEDQNEKSIFNFYNIVQLYNNEEALITDTREFLIQSHLKAQSIQALVVRKDIIAENGIEMVEGAIGQDTIYFQELLLNSSRVKVVDEVIHMYYGAISDSMTNTVGPSFFEKYLKLEKYRVEFLRQHDLLEHYINNRFEYYMLNWYLPRFERVEEDQKTSASSLLLQIFDLYAPYIDGRYSYIRDRIASE